MSKWYTRKDGTYCFKKGRYKVLEIFKRPHGGYCCQIFNCGLCEWSEGYFGTSLPKKYLAVRFGVKKAKSLNII